MNGLANSGLSRGETSKEHVEILRSKELNRNELGASERPFEGLSQRRDYLDEPIGVSVRIRMKTP